MRSDRLVNGVFQGGGAKAIALSGALGAVADRGVWFGSVAGTSAGSIAASLIAAGLRADQFDDLIPEALSAAQSPVVQRLALAAAGRATSVFEGEPLRRWLDDTYAEAIGHDRSAGPVTFEQLHQATGIELYVVSLDLATEWPVVFSRRTTPSVDVAGAVAASSAIPGAFPAGRAIVHSPLEGARIHQLMDGAGWANYPSFVFDDDAFRTWVQAEARRIGGWSDRSEAEWASEGARPVLGFVFGEPDPPPVHEHLGFVPIDTASIDRRFDLGPASTSSGRLTHLVGVVFSSDWARLTIGAALAIWVALSVATMPIAFRRFATWLAAWMPDAWYPIVLVASLTVAVLAVVTSIVVISSVVLVSRLLADTVLPAMTTVLGTPSEVPPWLGLGTTSVVVRVPRRGLSTIGFSVDRPTRQAAIDAARCGVAEQLEGPAGRRLDALLAHDPVPGRPISFGSAEVPTDGPSSHDDAVDAADEITRASSNQQSDERRRASSLLVTAVLVLMTAFVGVVAWWVTTASAAAGVWWIVGGVIAAVVAVAVTVAYSSQHARRQAHGRATTGVSTETGPGRRRPDPRLVAFIGVALAVSGLIVSFVGMDARRGETVVAEVVVAAESADGDNEYQVRRLDGVGPVLDLASERHLRIGERIFVEPGADTTASLVGPIDDPRFAAAIVLVALGVGTIASAVRTQRWFTRTSRLRSVAAARLDTSSTPDDGTLETGAE